MENQPVTKLVWIKTIYFYLVSFVTLMLLTVNSALLLNLGLKTYIFTAADDYGYGFAPTAICYDSVVKEGTAPKQLSAEECVKRDAENKKNEEKNRAANRQREAAENISFILVSLPLFILHWRAARKRE